MSSKYINFDKRRGLGQIVGDSFTFLFRNFGALLTVFLIYAGPFVLIGAFVNFSFTSLVDENSLFLSQYTFGMLAMYLAIMVGYVSLAAIVYASVRKYIDEPEEPLTSGVWPYFARSFGRMLTIFGVYLLLFLPFGIIIYLLSLAGGLGLGMIVLIMFAMVPIFLYLMVPLSLAQAIYLLEDIELMAAVRSAFTLIKGNWWETFGLIFIQSLIVSMVASIASIPMYIMVFTKAFSEGGDLVMDPAGTMVGATYLVTAVFSLFLSIYQVTGLSMQYFNLREKVYGTSLKSRIEQFGHEG